MFNKRSCLVFGFAALFSLLGCDGGKSVNDLYKFPGAKAGAEEAKEVRVHISVDYKLNLAGGPAVDVGAQEFLLVGYATGDTDVPVEIGTADQEPVLELPVTLTGTHVSFDAIVMVPASVTPGANGYTFHFSLKEKGTTLADAETVRNLDALRGDVQPGTAAADNEVPLSLATTLAYKLSKDVGATRAEAYGKLIETLAERLKAIEEKIDAAAAPDLKTFTAAILAGLKLEIMNSDSLQSELVTAMQPKDADGSVLAAIANSFTELLKTFATEVKSALGTGDTDAARLFKTGELDTTSIPDPDTYASVIFAPKGIAFTDQDTSVTIGGEATITAPTSEAGISQYNLYFGGETITTKGKLIGSVTKGTNPLKVTIANGTAIPEGATRFWVFPVAGDKELNLAASLAIVNVQNSAGVTLTPSTYDFGKVALPQAVAPRYAPGAVKEITVKNEGTDAATVSSIVLTNTTSYSISQNTCGDSYAEFSLPAGAECKVTLEFVPYDEGVITTELKVGYNNGQGAAEVKGNYTGIGVLEASIDLGNDMATVIFDSKGSGQTSVEQIRVRNFLGTASDIAISIAGADAAHFALTNNPCPSSLGEYEYCHVEVTLTYPDSPGMQLEAELVVTYNNGMRDVDPVVLQMRGTNSDCLASDKGGCAAPAK